MAAELVNPLFVGYIIDAIIAKDRAVIDKYVIIWMGITVTSSFINGVQSVVL